MFALVNGSVYGYDRDVARYVRHDTLVVDGDTVRSLRFDDVGAGIERIDLDGRFVFPAFADAHVHLTDTGRVIGVRDLSAVRSYDAFAEAIARLPRGQAFLVAGKYDDARWVDGREADARPLVASFADARALIVRVDAHSCLVSPRTFAELDLPPQTRGIERDAGGAPTLRLFHEANWIAQSRYIAAIPLTERRAAEARAVGLALSMGALHLHVQLLGFGDRDSYAAEIAALSAAGPAKYAPKVCELDPLLARDLGLPYVGGDLFLDGSIGSGTAALCAPYADREGRGSLRYSDAELTAFYARAASLNVAAGVHAIGDAAIEQSLRACESVLGDTPSQSRHFIEHFEMASAEQIARAARLGLVLSMQPQFDATWGSPGGMYERRLGWDRARTMNPIASALRAGAVVAGGDDSPVCELSPLTGMDAAMRHHEPSERVDAHQALAMYTRAPAYLARNETTTGDLAPGMRADFVILDRDIIADSSFATARVLETWRDGHCVYART